MMANKMAMLTSLAFILLTIITDMEAEVCKTKMTVAAVFDSTTGVQMTDFMEQQSFMIQLLNHLPSKNKRLALSVRVYYRPCPVSQIFMQSEGFWITKKIAEITKKIQQLAYFQAGHSFLWSCAWRMLSEAQTRADTDDSRRYNILLVHRNHLETIKSKLTEYGVQEQGNLTSRLVLLLFKDYLDGNFQAINGTRSPMLAFPLENLSRLSQTIGSLMCNGLDKPTKEIYRSSSMVSPSVAMVATSGAGSQTATPLPSLKLLSTSYFAAKSHSSSHVIAASIATTNSSWTSRQTMTRSTKEHVYSSANWKSYASLVSSHLTSSFIDAVRVSTIHTIGTSRIYRQQNITSYSGEQLPTRTSITSTSILGYLVSSSTSLFGLSSQAPKSMVSSSPQSFSPLISRHVTTIDKVAEAQVSSETWSKQQQRLSTSILLNSSTVLHAKVQSLSSSFIFPPYKSTTSGHQINSPFTATLNLTALPPMISTGKTLTNFIALATDSLLYSSTTKPPMMTMRSSVNELAFVSITLKASHSPYTTSFLNNTFITKRKTSLLGESLVPISSSTKVSAMRSQVSSSTLINSLATFVNSTNKLLKTPLASSSSSYVRSSGLYENSTSISNTDVRKSPEVLESSVDSGVLTNKYTITDSHFSMKSSTFTLSTSSSIEPRPSPSLSLAHTLLTSSKSSISTTIRRSTNLRYSSQRTTLISTLSSQQSHKYSKYISVSKDIKPTSSSARQFSSSVYPIPEVEKEVESFLEKNVTEEDLKNDTWTEGFVNSAGSILSKLETKENITSRNETPAGIKVVLFVEKVAVEIAKTLKVGESKIIKSDAIVMKVASVNTTSFSGLSFSAESSGSASDVLSLPPNLFDNMVTTGKADIAVFTYQSLNSMKYLRDKNVSPKTFSAKVNDLSITGLSPPLMYTMKVNRGEREVDCTYWDFTSRQTNYGGWSSAGCSVAFSNASHVTCACDHMTNFAVLIQVHDVEVSEKAKFTLMLMSYVGCGVSILGCLLLLAVFTTITKLLREDRNVIHVNLAMAIGIANVLFLVAEPARRNNIACTSVGIAMFYFFLAAFFWMLVEGIHVYLMVVKVFRSPKKLRAYFMIGWVVPALITAPVGLRLHNIFITDDFCWLSTEGGAKWAFAGPVIFVLLVNSVILFITLRASYKMGLSEDEYKQLRAMARLTLLLMPIFGTTWVFGLLTVNKDVILFQYVFTALNSLQGFFIFLFYCVFNSEVRREYQNIRKQSSYAATTSTSNSNERLRTKSWMTADTTTGSVKLVGWTPIVPAYRNDTKTNGFNRGNQQNIRNPPLDQDFMLLSPMRRQSSDSPESKDSNCPVAFSGKNGGSRTELLHLGPTHDDTASERSYASYKPYGTIF